jgi:hypothetical protein
MKTDAFGALSFKCPACRALPEKPCTMIDGALMLGQHSKRTELAFLSADLASPFSAPAAVPLTYASGSVSSSR